MILPETEEWFSKWVIFLIYSNYFRFCHSTLYLFSFSVSVTYVSFHFQDGFWASVDIVAYHWCGFEKFQFIIQILMVSERWLQKLDDNFSRYPKDWPTLEIQALPIDKNSQMFKIFKIQSADYLCSSFIVASKFTKAHLHLLMLVNFHIFFDIFQFLTPGCNLESFFKAFGLSEQKGYFPYEYFTDTNQLDVKKLSPLWGILFNNEVL